MTVEPLWITEQDVRSLISLEDAVTAVEAAFDAEALGCAANMTKTHLTWGSGHTLHAIGAIDEHADLVATKTWAHTAGGATPLLVVWSAQTGALVAIIQAFGLGQLRTGAVSAVATKWLSRRDATHLAVIGSGKQALSQVKAVAAVRPLKKVTIFSPNPEHREAFGQELEQSGFGFHVAVTGSVEDSVADADIVTTVTRARDPFLHSSMLPPGTHVNAVGAITPERRELAQSVVRRASLVVADSPTSARALAVEVEEVDHIIPLHEVISSGESFDRGDDLTLFKAMGVGLADLAIGTAAIRRATSAGLGRPIPMDVGGL